MFRGCDVAGYNIARFDFPLLLEEFRRAGVEFSAEDRFIVDAQNIFFRHQPRTLEAAVLHYTGEEMADAHRAMGDVSGTIEVLKAQLEQDDDIPRDVEGFHSYSKFPKRPSWFDEDGRLIWRGQDLCFNFGKHIGEPLAEVQSTNPGFLGWMHGKDFTEEVMDAVRMVQSGYTPTRPT